MTYDERYDERNPPPAGGFVVARQAGRIQIRSRHPMRLAELFLAERACSPDGDPLLIRWREDWYRWDPGAGYYGALDREILSADLRRFLDTLDVVEGGAEERAIVPLRVTRAITEEVACALPAVGCLVEGDAPQWLTGDGPPPDELLVAQNGLYHLPTGKLSPPTPRFFAVAGLGAPVLEDPEESFEWHQFLHSLWPEDFESIVCLQEWFGYLLTSHAELHKALLLVGPTRGGKGTIARVLRALLGEGSVGATTLSGLGDRFGLQPLLGKRLALIPDARISGRTDQAAIVERLLSVTGEDPLTVDRKNRDPVTAQIGARFMILTNEIPSISDSSGALANRFLTLQLQQSFLGKEDTGLDGRLLSELPSILGWAIEGWRRLRKRGRFLEPTSSREARAELARLSSPISAFLEDECALDADAETDVEEMWRAWKEWCEREGRRPGIRQHLGRALRAAAQVSITQPRTQEGSRVRRYQGIRLRPRLVSIQGSLT